MAVKALKPKARSGQTLSKHDPRRIQTKEDAEAYLVEIESDPNASPIGKELVAYIRKRAQSKEPYLTIEQILAELGRG